MSPPTKRRAAARVELIFDVFYLAAGALLGLYLLATAGGAQRRLYGIMALVLVCGDAFHLVPRIRAALTGDRGRFLRQLGVGKLVTSLTMTAFYLLLWHIGLLQFPSAQLAPWTALAYLLAALRVVLCLCPQNRWLAEEADPRWNLYRNLPFFLLGGMVMLLFLVLTPSGDPSFSLMWLAILLSYVFYFPVVFWSKKYPMLGMLMLPKSCVYLWIITMGLAL